MPDPNLISLNVLGFQANRAAALIPQTAQGDLFSVTGGRIYVVQIVGQVTVAIGAVANNTKLVANPTAAGADVDLCAVLDINGKAAGTLFGITGLFSDALIGAGVGALSGQTRPVIVAPGTIALNCAGNSVTGQVKWTLRYFPLDGGVKVAAV